MDFKTAAGETILDSSVCGAEAGSGRINEPRLWRSWEEWRRQMAAYMFLYSEIDCLFLFFLRILSVLVTVPYFESLEPLHELTRGHV